MSERICTSCGASLPGSAARCDVCGSLARDFSPSAHSDIGFPPQGGVENRGGASDRASYGARAGSQDAPTGSYDRPNSNGRYDEAAGPNRPSTGTEAAGPNRPGTGTEAAGPNKPGGRDRRASGMPRDIYDESFYPDRRLIPISASTFVGYYLLFLIPIIGLIAALSWSFSRKGPINRRNFARATLVIMVFSTVVLSIAAYVIMIVLKDMGLYFL